MIIILRGIRPSKQPGAIRFLPVTFLRSYLAHSPVGEDEVRRHLPTFRRFRAVVQAVYFSTRVQEENMLGGSGMFGNAKGLSDARHMLDELGDEGHRHPAERGR
jgi:hypothetical protein